MGGRRNGWRDGWRDGWRVMGFKGEYRFGSLVK
jgi:hypothetical protein